jgi:hypothetical protein
MSHYAQIVKPLKVFAPNAELVHPGGLQLAIGTQIKSVKLDGGVYTFKVLASGSPDEGPWFDVYTDEDLPAFTDKGSSHRARKVSATLRPGRPLASVEPAVRPIAFRPTAKQRAWIERTAARKLMTVSEYIRARLEADGMPR